MESKNSYNYGADNIKNVCRVCFELKSDTLSLCAEGARPLYDALVKEAKLNVQEDDGGPASICNNCFDELNIFVKFLHKCQRANEIFLQYRQKPKNTNNCDSSTKVTLTDSTEKKNSENRDEGTLCEEDEFTHTSSYEKVAVEPSSSVPYTCQFCSKVFTRKFNYELHLKRHSGCCEWRCPQCGGAALTRALALRHCRPRPRRACPAPACGKTFTSLANLNTHIRKHNGERPYACGDCGKTFGSSSTLSDHRRIHTGVKPYMCPTCGKRFTTNKLAEHMRTHAARAHACPACSRTFVSARAVLRHARTHAPPQREHACSACGARYNHKQSLNKHLRKRHGVKTS